MRPTPVWTRALPAWLIIFAASGPGPQAPAGAARYDWAERIARDLVAARPDDVRALLVLARALEARGKRHEAEETLRRGLAAADARRRKAEFLDRLGALALVRDDPNEAVRCLEEAIRNDPTRKGVHRRLGLVLSGLGRTEEAIARYRREIDLAPKDPQAHYLLAQALLDAGRPAEARPSFERAIALDPASPNAHYGLGQCLLRLGRREEARRALRRFRALVRREKRARLKEIRTREDARRAAHVCADIAVRVAAIHAAAGDADAAEALLRRTAREVPEAAGPLRALAELEIARGRKAEAVACYEEARRRAPEDPGIALALGSLYAEAGRFARAESCLLAAAKGAPEDPRPHRNLALLYLQARRRAREALRHARRVVEIDPAPASYDLLAWALYVNGDREGAEKAILRAIALDPRNPAYRRRLALIRGARRK